MANENEEEIFEKLLSFYKEMGWFQGPSQATDSSAPNVQNPEGAYLTFKLTKLEESEIRQILLTKNQINRETRKEHNEYHDIYKLLKKLYKDLGCKGPFPSYKTLFNTIKSSPLEIHIRID